MAILLGAFAAPAMAQDNNPNWWSWDNNPNWWSWNNGFDDNGIFQSTEQEVESGDSSQTFNVSGGGE
jgi:hypothetical protein